MVVLKKQSPFIDDNGNINQLLEKHYAEDECGKRYFVLQVDTGTEYRDAVDNVPCKHIYMPTNKLVEDNDGKI